MISLPICAAKHSLLKRDYGACIKIITFKYREALPLTTEHTEYTDEKKKWRFPCLPCIPWFASAGSSTGSEHQYGLRKTLQQAGEVEGKNFMAGSS